MAMFGAGSRQGSVAGFTPRAPNFIDRLGLVGDVLTHTNLIRDKLDGDNAFAQQQYQAAHPAPMNVGGNLVQADGQGGYQTVYSAPPKLDTFGQSLQSAGFQPGTPEWQQQYKLKVQNEVDPLHGYPTTDQQGNTGLIFKRPSEMGAAGAPAVHITGAADYQALSPGTPYIDPNGQHRVKGGSPQASGGAAPATGPGGFPLYPAGHKRH